MTRLLTAEQLVSDYGIPGIRSVRTMRQQGLAAVRIGKAYLFRAADVEAFIESRLECLAPTVDRACTGFPSEAPTTSCGMSAGPSASVQRARQTADKLKRRSPNSSAQVIDLQPARKNQAK